MAIMRHMAVELATLPGECRVCGVETWRAPDDSLRHMGERVPLFQPERDDRPSFGRAMDIAEAALDRLPKHPTNREVARAVVAALYLDGLLRRQRRKVLD